jgi:hypothetical protein
VALKLNLLFRAKEQDDCGKSASALALNYFLPTEWVITYCPRRSLHSIEHEKLQRQIKDAGDDNRHRNRDGGILCELALGH